MVLTWHSIVTHFLQVCLKTSTIEEKPRVLRIPGVKNLNYRNPSKFDLHLSDSPMVEGGHFLRYEKKLSRLL